MECRLTLVTAHLVVQIRLERLHIANDHPHVLERHPPARLSLRDAHGGRDDVPQLSAIELLLVEVRAHVGLDGVVLLDPVLLAVLVQELEEDGH